VTTPTSFDFAIMSRRKHESQERNEGPAVVDGIVFAFALRLAVAGGCGGLVRVKTV
jgi:hypothetical protein